MNYIALISIVSPLLGALLASLPIIKYRFFVILHMALLSTSLVSLVYLLINVDNKYISFPWFSLSDYNINIALYLDSRLILVSIIAVFIASVVSIYSFIYLKNNHISRIRNFFCLLNFFVFALIGFLLSDSLLLLFIFWELMGFSSFKLISFEQNENLSVLAGIKAVIINKVGDLALLFSIVLLFVVFKNFDLFFIKNEISHLGQYAFPNHFYLSLVGLGFIIAAIIKSGQMPFSGWLSSAMQAPIPASALIHSSTIVIIGIILIYKVNFLIIDSLYLFLALLGALTAFLGSLIAIYQHDIKKVLAYSTVAQVGFIYIAMGLKNFEGGLLHLIVHAFFKSLLFLLAGLLINIATSVNASNNYNPRSLNNIKYISGRLPLAIKILCAVAIGSLSGLPMFASYLSKESIINHIYNDGSYFYILLLLLVIIYLICTSIYSAKLASAIFVKHVNSKGKFECDYLTITVLTILALFCSFLLYSLNPLTLKPIILSKIIYQQEFRVHNHWLSILITVLVASCLVFSYLMYKRKNTYLYTNKYALFIYESLYINKAYKAIWKIISRLTLLCYFTNHVLNLGTNKLYNLFNFISKYFKAFEFWLNNKFLARVTAINILISRKLSALEFNSLQSVLLISFFSLLVVFVMLISFFI